MISGDDLLHHWLSRPDGIRPGTPGAGPHRSDADALRARRPSSRPGQTLVIPAITEATAHPLAVFRYRTLGCATDLCGPPVLVWPVRHRVQRISVDVVAAHYGLPADLRRCAR